MELNPGTVIFRLWHLTDAQIPSRASLIEICGKLNVFVFTLYQLGHYFN